MKEKILDKIKSKLAVMFIITIVITGKYYLFGFLFLIWVIIDLKNRQTYLLEIIQRSINPVLYWIIIIMWFVFALLSFVSESNYQGIS